MPHLTVSGQSISGDRKASYPAAVTRQSDKNAAILNCLKSGQVFTLDPDYPGGLIIYKSFYADFAGPGAAVGGEFDRTCTAVYAVGPIHLQPNSTREQREAALNTRITYAELLAEIANIAVPLRRSYRIVEQLSQWLSREIVIALPAELIAKMVGVLPISIELAQQSRKALASDMPTLLSN